MFAEKRIAPKVAFGFFLLTFSAAFCAPALAVDATGVFVATGTGTASSQADAEEAARLDAANNVVFKEMRRDAVYRDLLVPEAFKNGWFDPPVSKKSGSSGWTSSVTIRVDESAAEALYLGRYSTTVAALLDAAEEALAEIRSLQEMGGNAESNGDLGSAETGYRRAESKAAETMRYLGPVVDALFFSSKGNRKAPELKALIVAAKEAAADGVVRIRAVQERLAMDAEARNVLALLDSVEDELGPAEAAADDLHPLAAAPRSYETQLLRAAEDRGRSVRESLERRRAIVKGRADSLNAEMTYPRTRSALLLDRMDALDRSLKDSVSAIAGELRKRTPAAKIAAWAIGHEPLDYLSLGVLFPPGLSAREGGTVGVRLPATFNVRAEGAFPLGAGGFWARGRLRAGDEDSTGSSDYTMTQGIDIGFFKDKLFGVGFRWDWVREDDGGKNTASIPAIAVTIGDVGEGLGKTTFAPLWSATAAWELPDPDDPKAESDLIPVRSLNLALDATIRATSWLRFDADASARTRRREGGDWWIGSLGFGFGLRLPVLKPFLWKLRWEASSIAPIVDDEVQRSASVNSGALRFGLEYTF